MSPEIGFLLLEFDAVSDYRANAGAAPAAAGGRSRLAIMTQSRIYAREGRGDSARDRPPVRFHLRPQLLQRVLMSFNNVPSGRDLPQDFNVIIEIPAQSDPVKYEADKDMGLLVVDRFIGTGMRYPANYGFIPQTLSGDGDPVDVLVITPFPLLAGSVVRARALGMLQMTDESGVDAKLVAVPHDKICPMTANIKSIDDVPEYLKDQIKHFFENYKSLEKGKWVKVEGWAGIDAAHKEISEGVANFKK
jgi:inorganic pyrophosphatase